MKVAVKTHKLRGNNLHILTSDHFYKSFPKHYHETYSVAMLIEGAKSFNLQNRQCVLDQTNIATMNPGEIHSGESLTKAGWKQLVILFDEAVGNRFAEENELSRTNLTFEHIVKYDMSFRNEVKALCKSAIKSESELEAELISEQLMGILFANEKLINAQRIYKNRNGITKTIDLMYAEPESKHTLDMLAKTANMSKFHYIRSFKEDTGMTPPHAYLNVLRIERAKKLLLSTSDSYAEIAAECGFADQAHLIRAYKKIYGITPPGAMTRN